MADADDDGAWTAWREYDELRGQIMIPRKDDGKQPRLHWALEECPAGCRETDLRNTFQMCSALCYNYGYNC